jgi:hypothetical protein
MCHFLSGSYLTGWEHEKISCETLQLKHYRNTNMLKEVDDAVSHSNFCHLIFVIAPHNYCDHEECLENQVFLKYLWKANKLKLYTRENLQPNACHISKKLLYQSNTTTTLWSPSEAKD